MLLHVHSHRYTNLALINKQADGEEGLKVKDSSLGPTLSSLPHLLAGPLDVCMSRKKSCPAFSPVDMSASTASSPPMSPAFSKLSPPKVPSLRELGGTPFEASGIRTLLCTSCMSAWLVRRAGRSRRGVETAGERGGSATDAWS
jgi:hypothetical protein